MNIHLKLLLLLLLQSLVKSAGCEYTPDVVVIVVAVIGEVGVVVVVFGEEECKQ